MTQPFRDLEALAKSLEKDLQKGHRILSVFDLDSTLFDVSPRIQKILDELQTHPELTSRFPELLPLLKGVKTLRSDWGIKSAIQRTLQHQIPPLEFQKEARDFWSRLFFTNEYLHFDTLIEGSNEFVHSLHQMGSEIAYLTGRDWPRMGTGTVEVLKKWCFPIPGENQKTHLEMKPEKGGEDALFKSNWFRGVKTQNYHRILFFENEPVILHEVTKDHPEIEVVFVDTTHSGRAEPHEKWMTITDFKRK